MWKMTGRGCFVLAERGVYSLSDRLRSQSLYAGQVDGELLYAAYVLAALYVMRLVVRISDKAVRNGLCGILVPVMCFCAVVSSLTNWSWVVGFSPVSWKHHGYYDHQEAKHQEMVEKGNGQIWDILAEDPETV